MADINYDVVIVGGSLGGVAAALSAANQGVNVCLIESSAWLGGQFTAQGVTKPDENRFIETVGSTQSYRNFRHAVRAYYRNNYHLSPSGVAQPEFNPGGNYPGFTMEPLVGHNILNQLLTALPNVHVRLNNHVIQVEMNGNAVVSVTAIDPSDAATRYLASYFLDATDLGDLLPQCGQQGTDWVIGAESKLDTTEPAAPPAPHPEWIQGMTITFGIEHIPGGNFTIIPPTDYEQLKQDQNYTILDGDITTMFGPGENFWNYRSVILAANFADPAFPNDLTIVNMVGNDYQAETIPTGDPARDAQIIANAREASLGYLYWLQTECPRDDNPGQLGYPELKLKNFFDTPDGTAAQAYVRESRRIKAVKRVIQQEVDAAIAPGPRGALYQDACGIGYYAGMDVHGCKGVGTPEMFLTALPYQIPLGALIPVRLINLLPACKNIGVTHVTNGAYRLHPTEWSVGEAAGALAAFCIQNGTTPSAVQATGNQLKSFQHLLLAAGIPLYWWSDITSDMPIFAAVHLLGVNGIASGYQDMSYRPNDPLTSQDQQDIAAATGVELNWPSAEMTRGQAAQWLVQQLNL